VQPAEMRQAVTSRTYTATMRGRNAPTAGHDMNLNSGGWSLKWPPVFFITLRGAIGPLRIAPLCYRHHRPCSVADAASRFPETLAASFTLVAWPPLSVPLDAAGWIAETVGAASAVPARHDKSHRNSRPSYLSGPFFLSPLAGPLAAVLEWPVGKGNRSNSNGADRLLSGHVRRP
jgi:hypothetical protein